MFSHVMIGSNDIERSERFYNAVMGVFGIGAAAHNQNKTGQERLWYRHDGTALAVTQPIDGKPATAANGGTIGFKCTSPEQVQEFHAVAVAHGGTPVEDAPGPRNSGTGEIHLAYVLDPDGNKLCALYRA
ncbi:VOC family protein [Tianweitania sp. BSSL-BM11]|uniref:VOC family protein n=1 Tax=Tianweitania aestuarii TaxID=2814886 RepID=A0ABS5RXH7_9HYPH|nr:VOC family protein [Tianweitania aestuarii]MBS9721763.1 VOC family protein [Tianweitania aestuarii]